MGQRIAGRIAGRFTLGAKLGAGAAATVYEARDEREGRPVALKILDVFTEEAAPERLQQELRVTAQLRSPHTVRIIGHGETAAGAPYLALERLHGRPLGQVLDEDGELAWPQAVQLAVHIVHSLAEAHGAGIVHRDLKPGNVFVVEGDGKRPQAKVLDFGLARVAESLARTSLTETGMTVGSPAYMAPEQACGLELDGRSDLYALGALLFTMLVGIPPFVDADPVQLLVRACDEPAPLVTDLRPDFDGPPALVALVAQLLAKSPDERPADAAEVRGRLEALMATPRTMTPRAPAGPRLPGWSAPVAMMVLVGLAFGGMWVARTSSGEPTKQPAPVLVVEAAAPPVTDRASEPAGRLPALPAQADEPSAVRPALVVPPAAEEPAPSAPVPERRRKLEKRSPDGLLGYRN